MASRQVFTTLSAVLDFRKMFFMLGRFPFGPKARGAAAGAAAQAICAHECMAWAMGFKAYISEAKQIFEWKIGGCFSRRREDAKGEVSHRGAKTRRGQNENAETLKI